MAEDILGWCKSTVICPKVIYILQKLSNDQSTHSQKFRRLLSEWDLVWTFDDDGGCSLEGSWDALLFGYAVFTAIRKASAFPETYHDLGLLYQWSTGYCEEISKSQVLGSFAASTSESQRMSESHTSVEDGKCAKEEVNPHMFAFVFCSSKFAHGD